MSPARWVGSRLRTGGTISISRRLVRIGEDVPLLGHIAFGIIDRGTNLLQVRPTTLCTLSCVFCSVDAGPWSRHRQTEYIVDPRHLVRWFLHVKCYKVSEDVQAHIDAAGDPLTYEHIVELVRDLREIGGASVVSMETHGALLTRELAERLDDAGLSRLNLSIDSIDPELAARLAGTSGFDVRRVLEVAEYICTSLNMDLLIAPVWVPGLNDREIPRIIEFALDIGAGKRWPPLGIQKYEQHKYGRKPAGVRPMRWGEFYARLREWEEEYGVKLVLRPEDFGIRRDRRVPYAFTRFERVGVRVVGPGWLRGQWLGVARGRVVTLVGVKGEPPRGAKVSARVLRVKDNIYVAEVL